MTVWEYIKEKLQIVSDFFNVAYEQGYKDGQETVKKIRRKRHEKKL